MSTHIHVSGLSYFCTDDKLRQVFTPFGTVVLAQVLRDECGHSLGLGIVHMASSEDIERVFNAHQRFEVSGSHMDMWEPANQEDFQGVRIAAYELRGARGAQTGQDTGRGKSLKAFQGLVGLRHRLFQALVPSLKH